MLGKNLLIAAALITTLAAAPAIAAPAAPVTLTSEAKVERPTRVGGTVQLVPVANTGHLAPGDHITFANNFRNVSARPIEHFVVTNPLPPGVLLVSDAAPGYEVSVDSGKSWSALSAATVADGKGGRRHAEAEDVTQVRWIIAVIAPGASGSVQFHGLVR